MLNAAIRTAVCWAIGLGLWLWFFLGSQVALAGGEATADRSGPTTSPSNPTAIERSGGGVPAWQPSGKWSCWTTNSSCGPRAASPKALWFEGGSGGLICRYELQSRKTQVFSALDGLPLEQGCLARVTAATDERCAILIDRGEGYPHNRERVFLWHPKEGWRALPALDNGGWATDICFDAKGRPLALGSYSGAGAMTCAIVELVEGKWRRLCVVPRSEFIIPLPDGYMLGMPERCVSASVYTFVPLDDMTKTKTFKVAMRCPDGWNPEYFRGKGKTVIFLGHAASEISADGLVECPGSEYSGWDMKAGGLLSCQVLEQTGEQGRLRPQVAEAPDIDLSLWSIRGDWIFRDAGGGLWWCDKRWDGKKWQSITAGWQSPPNCYSLWDGNYARLADDGSHWSLAHPELPSNARRYDPKTQTAWSETSPTGKGEIQLVRYSGGNAEVLRSIPYEKSFGLPEFQTPDGDWWWHSGAYGSDRGIIRLTSKGLLEYPSKGNAIFLSPRGHVWCLRASGTEYARYDVKSDTFVADEPWDDFSFDIGQWKLSYIASLNSSPVYCKTDGQWAPFRTPFSSAEAGGSGNIVYKDRLLVTVSGIGVLEYNATLGQWARLTDSPQGASFDASGRRILSWPCVLVYDGDPWANFKPDPNEEQAFARLLTQMDDKSFKVREAATRGMVNELERFRSRIVEAADAPSTSAEVRARLKGILPSDGPLMSAPQSIFRTMHPILVPPK